MPLHTDFDVRQFRDVLAVYATGVTIVTTRDHDAAPVGVTVSSFNSVSLEPPLVLWSLAKSAYSLPVFETAKYWCVHVLAHHQDDLANRFARTGADKFSGVDMSEGLGGIPLLSGCAARLQCRTAFRYEGGDHVILVGEVLSLDRNDVAPLVFHGGKYAVATPRVPHLGLSESKVVEGHAGIEEDFLGYLLARAYFQFSQQRRQYSNHKGLSDAEYLILSGLLIKDGRRIDQIDSLISYTGYRAAPEIIDGLAARGLLRIAIADGTQSCHLTALGRETIAYVVAAVKALELDILNDLGAGATASLKNLLKKIIVHTDTGMPYLWADK